LLLFLFIYILSLVRRRSYSIAVVVSLHYPEIAKGNKNAVGDANDDDFKPSKGGLGFLAGFERSEEAVDPELQDNSQDTPADSSKAHRVDESPH
jgi:hypothetical protein